MSSGTISRAGDTRVQTPEIDLVAPHHPAQEQVQPLARAARRRPRKEIAHAGALRHPAVGATDVERQRPRRKAVERGADVGARRRSRLPGRMLRSSRDSLEHLPQDPEQRGDVVAARPAVHHRPQLADARVPDRTPHVLGRARPHDGEQRVDGVEHAGDAAERQRRGAEAGDFPIARIGEGPDAVDRIARRVLAVVVAIETVERPSWPRDGSVALDAHVAA